MIDFSWRQYLCLHSFLLERVQHHPLSIPKRVCLLLNFARIDGALNSHHRSGGVLASDCRSEPLLHLGLDTFVGTCLFRDVLLGVVRIEHHVQVANGLLVQFLS